MSETDIDEAKLKSIAGEAWIKKRQRSLYVFYLQFLTIGMEYSLSFATLYLYLHDVIKTDHLVVFYSAISSIYVITKIIAALILSPIFDHNRRLRFFMITGNILIALGNALYTIPLSPWLPFAGRFISGCVALRPIVTAEVIRSHTAEVSLQKCSLFGMMVGLGIIVGPAINFVFTKSDFLFLGIRIGYANGAGFFLTFVFLLMTLLSILFVHDLSREFDLKEYLRVKNGSLGENQESRVNEESSSDIEKKTTEDSTNIQGIEDAQEIDANRDNEVDSNLNGKISSKAIHLDKVEREWIEMDFENEDLFVKEQRTEGEKLIYQNSRQEESDIDLNSYRGSMKVVFKLMENSNTACILLFAFFFMFCLISSDVWMPMLCKDILDWGIVEINSVTLALGVGIALAIVLVFFEAAQYKEFGLHRYLLCHLFDLCTNYICYFQGTWIILHSQKIGNLQNFV